MKFCHDNWEDIRKYFQGSYMKLPAIGDEVVYVTNVSSSGMTGKQLAREDSDGWQFTFGASADETEVEFVLPKKSFFEYENSAHLLSRIPAKQYSRGICQDNTSVIKLTVDGFVSVPLSLELINAYTAKPAFQGFRANYEGKSYPVSPRMAVCAGGRIFMDKTRIGFFNPVTGSINCNQEMFMPEIERIVREHGQHVLKLTCTKRPPPPKRTPKEQKMDGSMSMFAELAAAVPEMETNF